MHNIIKQCAFVQASPKNIIMDAATIVHSSNANFNYVDTRHNITQLFRCIPWDYVSHEHNSHSILEFHVYKEHSCCVL